MDYYGALLKGSPDSPTLLLSRSYDFSDRVTGPYNTSSILGSVLFKLDIWKEFHSTSAATVMDRFRYIRADSAFELRVNANSFFYGSLLMCWTPEDRFFSSDVINTFIGSSTPHVVVAVNGDTYGEIKIPYFNANPSVDQRCSGPGSLGYLTVMTYTPLRCVTVADSSTNLQISLMGNFVNPVVDGPMAV